MSVCPQFFFQFQRNSVCRGRCVMPYDLIQGQDPQKVAKMADFKVYLLCRYACDQKTDREL